MREIKFRVYDKSTDTVNYKVQVGMWGDSATDDKNYTACSLWCDVKKEWLHFEPYDKDMFLMQYVGFKDCNGKDIYEGDYVQTPLGKTVCKIRGGILKFIVTGFYRDEYNSDLSVCEIIGNKYSDRII